jgi:hypothetical protein
MLKCHVDLCRQAPQWQVRLGCGNGRLPCCVESEQLHTLMHEEQQTLLLCWVLSEECSVQAAVMSCAPLLHHGSATAMIRL